MAQGIVEVTRTEVSTTADGTYHDIDVSAYVPAGAEGVVLEIVNPDGAEYDYCVRKNGSSDDFYNGGGGRGIEPTGWTIQAIGVDVDRIFEAAMENAAVEIYIVGYVPDGCGEFFTNAVNKSTESGDIEDVDISGDIDGGTAKIAFFVAGITHGVSDRFALRENGSTDNFRVDRDMYSEAVRGACMSVDVNEVLEQYCEWIGLTISLYLVGCIYDDYAVSWVNQKAAASTVNGYKDTTLTDVPADSNGAFIYMDNAGDGNEYAFGVRKNGLLHDSYYDVTETQYGYCAVASRVLEQKIENNNCDLYYFAYVTEPAGGVTHEGAATLSGVGTLAGIGKGIFIGKSTLSGLGTLASIGSFIRFGKVALNGVGSLSALGRRLVNGIATLAGTGLLSAIGTVGAVIQYGAATLSGAGTLVASAVASLIGKATASGVGSLTALAVSSLIGKALLSGKGRLSTNWANRIKLTIDSGDIDDTLPWFPIRVHLSTSSGRNSADVSCVFDELGNDANRKKIAITKADGITQLYVEIEKWDDVNEEAELWVSRDGWEIASGLDTELYLYYDSSHVDNDTYVGDTGSTPAEKVWDANFKIVYHMRDDPDTSHVRDSTGNNNDGTKKGAGEPALTQDGKISEAQDFDGSNDSISLGSRLYTGIVTIEAIIKLDTTVQESAIAGQHGRGVYWRERGTGFGYDNGILFLLGDSGGGAGDELTVALNDTASFHYIAGVTHTASGKLYLDGAEVDTGSINGDWGWYFAIGAAGYRDTPPYAYPFAGIIDEVRVSSIARTLTWTKATKESSWDDLIAFGSEESVGIIEPVGVTGRLIAIGKALLSGTGTLAAAGHNIVIGVLTLAGEGTLAGLAGVLRLGVATLSGIGSLVTSAVNTLIGKTTLSGVGSLSVSKIIRIVGRMKRVSFIHNLGRVRPFYSLGKMLSKYTLGKRR